MVSTIVATQAREGIITTKEQAEQAYDKILKEKGDKRLKVHTAQYRYSGKDRLDITVKGKDPLGSIFAPTWDMVNGLKSGKISEEEYTYQYDKILNRVKKLTWDYLLVQKKLTLVCFCPLGAFCHRILLAKRLVEMGAIYKGERRIN